MVNEVWKNIEGYEGFYQVSNLGRVKSLKCRHSLWGKDAVLVEREMIMTPFDNGNGYLVVGLKQDGTRKNHYVHRLVAQAFIEKPEGKNYINHLDHNRGNNRVLNLQWCTQRENVNYSKQLMCGPRKNCKPSNTGVKYIHFAKKSRVFRVCIKKYGIDKRFKTLEEAVAYRNEVLDEIGFAV